MTQEFLKTYVDIRTVQLVPDLIGHGVVAVPGDGGGGQGVVDAHVDGEDDLDGAGHSADQDEEGQTEHEGVEPEETGAPLGHGAKPNHGHQEGKASATCNRKDVVG